MKVLVIGGGGKEHAIVWKLSQSRYVDRIYCCPGNAGIAEIADLLDVSPYDFDALIDFVKYKWINLTIVCSKGPLLKGIVEAFEREGCSILGPQSSALQLDSSRVFAKDLMRLYQIPTARYKVFTSYLHAEDYVRLKGAPIVIKTDSPVEGGVFIALTVDEAVEILRLVMKEMAFGDAGKRIIVEDNLKGKEVSFMVLTDGRTIIPLVSSKNYSRLLNGNTGPDTTGMGACSPVPTITNKLEATVIEKIVRPTLRALNSEGIKYKGILHTSLMIDKGIPYVLNFECGFGDPVTQAVLPRLKTDLMEIALATVGERLSRIEIEWIEKASVCVVITSEGYPRKYKEGVVINGLKKLKTMKDVFLFHIDTSFSNSDVVTSGGRVMSVTALGTDIIHARTKAYGAIKKIHFDGMHYRTDIGEEV